MKKVLNGILLLVFLFVSLTIASRLFGYQYYAVISDSMNPSIPKYSLVYVKRVSSIEARELIVGDVIAVKTTTIPLMHRIIHIDDDKIIMHGDHNDEGVNEEVSFNEVIGVVRLSIPVIGILFIHSLILPSIALFVIIIIVIKEIQKEVVKNRR